MAQQWTKEQQSAIEARGSNLLVAAAAGSGKTAVLVERIIGHITRDGVDIDRLLVVTFTNAAAAEMRERIGEAVVHALEETPGDRNLERQMALLSRSAITTMHSFCLEVVRSHFHKLDIDPAFRIADATESAILMEEALEEVLDAAYEEGHHDFLRLVDAYGGTKDDNGLKKIMEGLHRFIMSHPWPMAWMDASVERFRMEGGVEGLPFYPRLKAQLAHQLAEHAAQLESAMELAESTELTAGYGKTLQVDRERLEVLRNSLEEASFDALRKAFLAVTFDRLTGAKRGHDKELAEKVKEARNTYKEFIKSSREQYFSLSEEEHQTLMGELHRLMDALNRLMHALLDTFSAKKREKNLLDFNDLEHMALAVLTEEKEGKVVSSPVAEHYREKFHEVLVDEYQDSNEIQEVLIGMVSRRDQEHQNVFMVGDVKQSIYRFRQAKPELFMEKYRRYETGAAAAERKILLYRNFRSRRNILRMVNYVFQGIMSEAAGELDYSEEEALIPGADYYYPPSEASPEEVPLEERERDPTVEVLLMEEEDLGEEEGTGTSEEDTEPALSPEDFKAIEVEAHMVAMRIKALVASGFPVHDRSMGGQRPVTYKDIVILMRATATPAPIFQEALKQAEVPCFSDNALGYFDTIEIRTMMALLETIDNPLQDVPLLSVLRSPIFGFTEEELAQLRVVDGKEHLFTNLEQGVFQDPLGKKRDYFLQKFRGFRDRSRYQRLDEFIWDLYRETAYYDYVGAMPQGAQRQANLRLLFQRARQFENTSLKGLFNFVRFIDRMKRSNGDYGSAKTLGENENLVRIMSIHKSKGLEFPVVVLANSGKGFNQGDLRQPILLHESLGMGPLYVDPLRGITSTHLVREAIKEKLAMENLSEEMRILYVAMTRAKEKLIITGTVKDREKTLEKWTGLSAGEGLALPPEKVVKSKSYLDWIMAVLLKHPDLMHLRRDVRGKALGTPGMVELVFQGKGTVLADKEQGQEEIGAFTLNQLETRGEGFEVEKRLSYRYPHEKDVHTASKITVTELKKSRDRLEGEDRGAELFKESELPRPAFLAKAQGLTGAERGTAYHKVFQHLDFTRNGLEAVRAQLGELLSREILLAVEAEVVDPAKIQALFETPLGARMRQAEERGALEKEVLFYGLVEESEMMVIGVIDAFFEEEDGLVLVDYKTDRVPQDGLPLLEERYREQLTHYAGALARITGKPVKEVYIYSIHLDGAHRMIL